MKSTRDEIEEAAERLARSWGCTPPGSARAKPLTLGQVAAICEVSNGTAAKWCDIGLLRHYRLPDCEYRRVLREDLAAFMRAHGMPSRRVDLIELSG
jgi:hypothetical protein